MATRENDFCKCAEHVVGQLTTEKFVVCDGVSGDPWLVDADDMKSYLLSGLSEDTPPSEGDYLLGFDSNRNLTYIPYNPNSEYLFSNEEMLFGALSNPLGGARIWQGTETYNITTPPPEGMLPTHAILSIRAHDHNWHETVVYDEDGRLLFITQGFGDASDHSAMVHNVKAPISYNSGLSSYDLTLTTLCNDSRYFNLSVIGFSTTNEGGGGGVVVDGPLSSGGVTATGDPYDITYLYHECHGITGSDVTEIQWIKDDTLADSDLYELVFYFGGGSDDYETVQLSGSAYACDKLQATINWTDPLDSAVRISATVSANSISDYAISNTGTKDVLNDACKKTVAV